MSMALDHITHQLDQGSLVHRLGQEEHKRRELIICWSGSPFQSDDPNAMLAISGIEANGTWPDIPPKANRLC
jgi:hypothetical protein